MKVYATLVSLALATVAVAQNIPPCAQECVNPFLQNGIGSCGSDAKCICGSQEFITGISCCLADKCSAADQQLAINFAGTFCGGLGVTTLPTTVACATKTAAPSGSSTGAASTTPTGSAGPASTNALSSKSGNYGPRQTAAPVLGAIGGLVAAVALL